MTDFRHVTDAFAVSPQITPADVARAKAEGFTLIINNRPDNESPGQPAGAEIEAAARASGLNYVEIPISGRPTLEQANAVTRAVAAANGRTLAFCRSGTRSITAWAMGQLAAGAESRAALVREAAAAGYDIGAVLPE